MSRASSGPSAGEIRRSGRATGTVGDVAEDPSDELEATAGRAEERSDASGDQATTRPLRDEDIVDALPEDLDAAGYVGPYLFPNNNRRRIPAVLYVVIAVGCAAAYLLTAGDDPVVVNAGFAWAAVGLFAVGCYSWLAGYDLEVDEREALVVAVRQVGFPVGHASAQMGWRGLRSRPTWRILLYSAEDPPSTRGLVLVDGVDGAVVEWFTEENPEDWSEIST